MAFTLMGALAWIALLASPPAAHGQGESGQGAEEGVGVRFDVSALIRANEVFTNSLSGPVWQISARDGTRLMRVAMSIDAPESEVELGRPPIGVRGGYFIAWQLERPQVPDVRDRDRRQQYDQRDRWSDRPGDMGWRPDGPEDWSVPPSARGGPSYAQRGEPRTSLLPSPSEEVAQPVEFVFPEGAPSFARRLTLLPEGRVQWGIERSLPDGEVRSGQSPWLAKVRPDRLRERMPEPPDDRRDREAMRRYREQVQEALAFRQQVGDLPDEFEIPLPERLWAVYAVIEHRDDLSFTGEVDFLPWTIQRDDLDMLRRFAGQRARRGSRDGGVERDRQEQIRRMIELAADDHPLTLRTIAYALHEAGAVAQMEDDGSLERLARHIIDGSDEMARQRVLRDLAGADPPTPATVALLRDAASRMDSETRLIALRGMLRAAPTRMQQQREMFRIANQLLADPAGPEPGEVLAELVENVDRESPLMVGAIHGMDFALLPAERRDQAIAFAIRQAGMHSLAENWLAHRLLGASEPQLVRRTLELLNRVDVGPTPLTPMIQAAFDLVFDRRDSAAEMDETDRDLDLRMDVLVPLDSDNHSLFRALNSGDPEIYELAWGALPAFRIVRGAEDESDDVADRYEMVVDAALSRGTVPVAVVTFLERQSNESLAARGLVRVALAGDDAAVVEVVRALYGSRLPLGEALERLDSSERAEFASKVYLTLAHEVPLTVGLMREPGERPAVVGWFGEEVAGGRLPEAGDWAEAYEDERALLELAVVREADEQEGEGDVELARGAVAALVGSVGGDADLAEELAHRFTAEPGRSVSDLESDWRSARRDIHARRLAEAAGDYRLVVQPPASLDEPGRPAPIVMGVVELVVEGGQAYLGRNQTVSLTSPDERFAIRIEQPNDLKNLPNAEIADLPLGDIDGSLDLLRQPDGSWRGEAQMGEHGLVEVRLEPAQ